MRNMLVAALAFGMALGFSSPASAGLATLDPAQSFLDIKLGSIPRIRLDAESASVTISGGAGAHTIAESASVFQTDTYMVPSATLINSFPALSGLKISLHAGIGNFGEGATYVNPVGPGTTISGFGGLEANTGFLILIAGGHQFLLSLGNIGSGGMTTLAAVLQNVLVITGAPFNTGVAVITGLSSNILRVPSLGSITGVAFTLNLTTVQLLTAIELTTGEGAKLENSMVTLSSGFNGLGSEDSSGQIKMVSPFRLKTEGLAGNIAGSFTKTFTFVPEPGTVLLLISGAAGLAIVGRKRMRK
ncbi:MAG: PEP-CTERM sorting domain-containing protein [Myxococcales bacterium]|nr:PEP-CTERM sorting domain-containing protein [Myxococcales bacterium]